MNSYQVRFWDIKKISDTARGRQRVRWAVDGREHCKSFAAKALADAFLGTLKDAARDGKPFDPVGFLNSAPVLTWLSRGSLVFVDEAAENGPALDPLPGEVGDGVVRTRRVQLAAAVGPASVVVGLVLGQDRAQVPRAEDQHPVGDLGPGGEHEPLRKCVRPRAWGRDLHGLDAGGGQGRVERIGELPGAVAEQEPEAGGAVPEVHQQVADLLGSPPAVRMGGDSRGYERSGSRVR